MTINTGKINIELGKIEDANMVKDFRYVLKNSFNLKDISGMDYNTEFGKNPNYETYGAVCDNRLVGISQTRLGSEYAVLKWLAVINEYRNYKIGTTLLGQTIANLTKNHTDIPYLVLECSSRGESETFFPRFGFVSYESNINELKTTGKKMVLDLNLYK